MGLADQAEQPPFGVAGDRRLDGVGCEADFDESHPGESMRRLLADASTKFMIRGKRCGFGEMFGRLRKNRAASRGAM